LSSDQQHGRGEKPSSTSSKSARIRKAPAVAAFGAQGELALKLRALGDELDDVVTGLRNRDALAIGNARKLIVSWRTIGEPLLWYPTELRSAGKLVLAAELERACFVLPAYQAGLRAIILTDRTTADDVLAFADQLLKLEQGELAHEAFFMWLWSGNPTGLETLLGHPLTAMPGMVLEQPIPPEEIWQSHTAAAIEEWNTLAWNAAQAQRGEALEQRYRAPAIGLARRIDRGDVGLSSEEVDQLRSSCDAGFDTAQLALLLAQPELSALLAPTEAADVIRAAIAARAKVSALLQCIGMMSEPAAAAAFAAEPRLMQHAPRLCHELLGGRSARTSLLMRALLSHGAGGARALCMALAENEAQRFDGNLIDTVLGAFVDLGHGSELLMPLWTRRGAPVAARALALQAIGRDRALLDQALTLAPLTANDAPELHALASALRGSGT
jgi:hypothetical protein